MTSALRDIWAGFASASLLDQANLALGMIGVWLMIRRQIAAFPVGLVAVSVQGVLFWQAKFYADALLQIFFFILLGYGWWYWSRPRNGATELPVTTQSWTARATTVVLAVAGWLGWMTFARVYTDSPMPGRDGFIASFSVAAQLLQARKKLENWSIWLAVNAVAVWSYAAAGLHFTSFLYLVYFALALTGWRSWSEARTIA